MFFFTDIIIKNIGFLEVGKTAREAEIGVREWRIKRFQISSLEKNRLKALKYGL